MSMIRCDECDRIFDSDEDPDCFSQDESVRCESCRESNWQEGIKEHIGVTERASVDLIQSMVRKLVADAEAKRGDRPQCASLEYKVWSAYGPNWRAHLYWGEHKPGTGGEGATPQEAIKRCLDQIQAAPDLVAILGLEAA